MTEKNKLVFMWLLMIIISCTPYYESDDWLIENEYDGKCEHRYLWNPSYDIPCRLTIYSNIDNHERKSRLMCLTSNGKNYYDVDIDYADYKINKEFK